MSRRVLPLALVLALAATAGAGLVATRGGSSEDAGTHPATVPDWFLPISDAYDRSPAITPATDFAALYDARPATYAVLTIRPRELEVLGLLSAGITNADIAERLVLSPRTVDHHVSASCASSTLEPAGRPSLRRRASACSERWVAPHDK